MRVLLGFTGNAAADDDIAAIARHCSADAAGSRRPPRPDAATIEIVSVTDADEEVRHAVRVVVDAARARHAVGAHRDPVADRPTVRAARRAPSRRRRHRLERAARARRSANASCPASCSTCSTSIGAVFAGATCSTCSPTCRSATAPAARCRSPRGSAPAATRASSRTSSGSPRLRAYAAWQRRAAADRHGDDEPSLDSPPSSPDRRRRRVAGDRSSPTSATTSGRPERHPAVERLGRLGGGTDQRSARHRHVAAPRARPSSRRGSTPPACSTGCATSTPSASRRRGSEFRAVFAAEFDVAPGRLGRIGAGVTIGSLAGSVGLVADLAIVLGAADGLMPAAPTIDPLIGDADRRAAGLATSDSVAARMHRQLLGLFDSAPASDRHDASRRSAHGHHATAVTLAGRRDRRDALRDRRQLRVGTAGTRRSQPTPASTGCAATAQRC